MDAKPGAIAMGEDSAVTKPNALSVLVLDDDPSLRQALRTVFEEQQWRVIEAGSLEQARQLLADHEIDVALIDGLLPDGRGTDFIAEIRDLPRRPKLGFMSAFFKDMATYFQLTKELGVSFVLRKPLVPMEVVCQIAGLFEKTRDRLGTEEFAGVEVPSDVSVTLAALKSHFGKRLGAKLDALEERVASAASGSTSSEARREALELSHRLHGTCGTYGFANVGEACGRVERLLQEAESSDAPNADVWTEVREALVDARVALQDERAEDAPPETDEDGVYQATILIVDSCRTSLSELEQTGREKLLRVLIADNDKEAVGLAKQNWLDGAVLSLGRPGQDPLGLIRRLRSLPGFGNLPVALVSDDDSMENRQAAIQLGADFYLKGPLDLTALTRVTTNFRSAQKASRPKILLIEDDDAFAAVVTRTLGERGIDIIHAQNPANVFELIERERPELVLLDIVLPGVSGFDVCRMIRMTPTWQDLPVLFVTGRMGQEVRESAFRAGADDYITKPIVEEELVSRIMVRLERQRSATERLQRDPVTDLLLRGPFTTNFNVRFSGVRRRGAELTLALVDLDHFKKVNDTHGHLTGDRVLAVLGRILALQLRAEDLSCRWGGEEFAIAFFDQSVDSASASLSRILEEFGAYPFQNERNERFHVSFSAGLASFPSDGVSLEELIRRADLKLYEAKDSGRGRIAT